MLHKPAEMYAVSARPESTKNIILKNKVRIYSDMLRIDIPFKEDVKLKLQIFRPYFKVCFR